MSDIIIPATILSDCPMSELSDLFAVNIIPNSFLCQPKTRSVRKVILLNIWNYPQIRDMLSGEEKRLNIGILGGARCSVHQKQIVNLVTLSGQRQRDQQSGSILIRVLISRIVLQRLFARHICPP